MDWARTASHCEQGNTKGEAMTPYQQGEAAAKHDSNRAKGMPRTVNPYPCFGQFGKWTDWQDGYRAELERQDSPTMERTHEETT